MLTQLYNVVKDLFLFIFYPARKVFNYLKKEHDINKLDNISYAKFKIRKKRIDSVNDEY